MNLFFDSIFEKFYQKNPLILVDIGACGGIQSNWKKTSKHLKVIGFEPDERAYLELKSQQNDLLTYLNIGLHNSSGTLKINITKGLGKSSLFKPNRELLDRFPN